VRLLADRTGASLIQGVDPSPTMREAATRTNRAAVRVGRVVLALGTAEHTGLADQSIDHVVSVNNVAIWPDLDAAVRELHRVVRSGGTVVLAWHGGTAPSRIAQRLCLPEDKLNHIEDCLSERFRDVTQHRLESLDVFKAIR
jgi:SAM-dependent methyltransferase